MALTRPRPQNLSRYTTPDDAALAACRNAKLFENRGDYRGASAALRDYWKGPGHEPSVADLGHEAMAAVLLRVGVISVRLGSSEPKPERLIRTARELCETVGATAGAAECMAELASCLWRGGETTAARRLINDALLLAGDDVAVKGLAIVYLASFDWSAGRHSAAEQLLMAESALFECLEDPTIKGCYHNSLHLALSALGLKTGEADYFERAFLELIAASVHFEEAENFTYLAAVQNNLGFIINLLGKPEEAFGYYDRALSIYQSIGDRQGAGRVAESLASLYLSCGLPDVALAVIEQALPDLEAGTVAPAFSSEALCTYGHILARLGRNDDAARAFGRAAFFGHRAQAPERIESAVSAMAKLTPPPFHPDAKAGAPYAPAGETIEVIAPDEALSLALIRAGDRVRLYRHTEPLDGDLVAVSFGDEIILGFYFGRPGDRVAVEFAHPLLKAREFDRDAVKVLGAFPS